MAKGVAEINVPGIADVGWEGGEIGIAPTTGVQGIAAHLDDLTLLGERGASAVIGPGITQADLERSIEGASTLTLGVEDGNRQLLTSELATTRADLELDGLWFRLVKVGRQGYITELTFEDREVARLRKPGKALRVKRGKMTRAEFIRKMVRQTPGEKIPFFCPELHKRQPIASAKQGRKAKASGKAQSGLSAKSAKGLTVKGKPANPNQIRNADTVLRTGASKNAPKKVHISAIAAAIAESLLENLRGGDRDSVGVFQQRPSQGWPASGDVAKDSDAYYDYAIKVYKQNPNLSAAAIAGRTQRPQDPSVYNKYINEAEEFYKRFVGGAGAATSVASSAESSKPGKFAFKRKKKESTWDCSGRLAEEVGWRRFVTGGTFFYISEQDLYAGDTRMVLAPGVPGFDDDLDFNYDLGTDIAELTVSVRCQRWEAPPGTVAAVEGYGVADGRYLVTNIETSLFSEDAEVTLKTPIAELPEPRGRTKRKAAKKTAAKAKAGGGSSAEALADVKITRTAPGAPGWGGTADIFDQFVHPFMRRRGLSIGGQKEPGHATGGDHDPNSRTSYACDYGTTSGAGAANALGQAMGRGGSSTGTFATFNIKVDGRSFRVQILWGVRDHYDHVHVGIRAI